MSFKTVDRAFPTSALARAATATLLAAQLAMLPIAPCAFTAADASAHSPRLFAFALAEGAEVAQAAEISASERTSAQEIDIVTPRKGIAVAAPAEKTGTVPLFKEASENSPVMMEYYSGAQLEVVGFSGSGDMVRVQCGVKGASITGYMRVGDLRYGEYAERKVPRCEMRITLNGGSENVYSYPDLQAPVIGEKGADYDDSFYVQSRSDSKWVQMNDQWPLRYFNRFTAESDIIENGFLYLPAGAATGKFQELEGWFIHPSEVDLSYEQARERAIDHALENQVLLTSIYPDGVTREFLERMQMQLNLCCLSVERGVRWEIFFDDPDDSEKAFCVQMHEDGSLCVLEIAHG